MLDLVHEWKCPWEYSWSWHVNEWRRFLRIKVVILNKFGTSLIWGLKKFRYWSQPEFHAFVKKKSFRTPGAQNVRRAMMGLTTDESRIQVLVSRKRIRINKYSFAELTY